MAVETLNLSGREGLNLVDRSGICEVGGKLGVLREKQFELFIIERNILI
jgi:hypothetical protein